MDRLRANTLTLVASNAGTAALSFVLSALIGRVLGESGLGVYAAALAWTFPLSIIADAGMATLLTREVAADVRLGPAYLRATAPARMLFGGGLALLLIVAASLLSSSGDVVRGIQIAAPLVATAPIYGAFTALFRAQRVMWPIAALNLGMLAAQVTLTALVFVAGGGVLLALAVNTLTSTGQMLAAWGLYRRRFAPSEASAAASPVPGTLALLRQAWPFALAAILAALHIRLSVILLERFTDTATTGIYAAAARFIEGGTMVTRAYFDALFPALAAVAWMSSARADLFRRARSVMLLLGGGFALGGVLLGPALITLVYGPTFEAAGSVLQIAALGLLPATLKSGYLLYGYATGREALANSVVAGTLLLRLVMSVVLIPAGGAVGAALAGLTVELSAYLVLALALRRDMAESKRGPSLGRSPHGTR